MVIALEAKPTQTKVVSQDDRLGEQRLPVLEEVLEEIADQNDRFEPTVLTLDSLDKLDPPSLEDFLANPLKRVEWINGQLVEQTAMTAKTGRIQAKLARHLGNYQESSGQGGEVYVETSCRTTGRVRCPDVAYLDAAQVAEQGDFKVLPHSFPFVAEIISPNDGAEEVFQKVREYLESQAQEVWLVFPDSGWVLTITATAQALVQGDDAVSTHAVLPGFSIPVADLLA